MKTPTPDEIAGLLAYFAPHCRDLSTMKRLQRIAVTPRRWKTCHALFYRIRKKTLKADARRDTFLQHQYSFEEICAKALYNMSVKPEAYATVYPAPFDDDSPEFIVPLAHAFADHLRVPRPRLSELAWLIQQRDRNAITACCTGAGGAGVAKWIRRLFRFGEY